MGEEGLGGERIGSSFRGGDVRGEEGREGGEVTGEPGGEQEWRGENEDAAEEKGVNSAVRRVKKVDRRVERYGEPTSRR